MRSPRVLAVGCAIASALVVPRAPLRSVSRCAKTRRTPEPLSIEELEAMEADLLRPPGEEGPSLRPRPPMLGRECAAYRWTQDGSSVRVEVPLPFAPPRSDVSLVVGVDSFALGVVNANVEIRGDLGGFCIAHASTWDVARGPGGEASVVATILKGKADDDDACGIFWREFLRDEAPQPTVAYAGIDAASGARFCQTAGGVDVEVSLPDGCAAADVDVEVTRGDWRVTVRGSVFTGGSLVGAVDLGETVWFVDGDTLHVAIAKARAEPWPGLSLPPPDVMGGA